jgi:two-component system OmpR family sensor kinase
VAVRQWLPAEPGTGERALAELLPRLGHELRGPVQVIKGFVELLLAEQAGPLTPEQRRYLEETRRSCQRLTRFARELSSGDDASTAPVSPRAASLARLAESVAAGMKPLLDRRRQTLRLRVAPGASEGCFDPARVEQVLQNLIANASEHGPEGGAIDLEAEAVEGPRGIDLLVSVTDDGPGLPQHCESPARPGRGFGLGICRAIVAAHGGRFLTERAAGRGARVCFTLAGPSEESA